MRLLSLLLLLCGAPTLAHSQSTAYPDLLPDWQRNRATVLAYIDAMPDSATGFRPTPGVRTLAEQFDHIVGANLETAAVALRGLKAAPAMSDSAVYLHDKAALRRYAEANYDYFLQALTRATPAQLRRQVSIFGLPAQPALRLAGLA